MGKIVKFCSSCDEGFAEKFGFCPNCGQTLQTFEMSPVVAEAPPVQEAPIPEPVVAAPVADDTTEAFKTYIEPVQEAAQGAETVETIEEPVLAQAIEQEPTVQEPEEEVAAPKAAVAAPTFAFTQAKAIDVDRKPVSLEAEHAKFTDAGGFYVTVIEEKNVKQRNALLFGTLALVLFSLMTGLVYNIFSKDLEVGSINDDVFNAVIVDDIPTTEEKEVVQKRENGGGGGGGGNNDPNPASQGERAPMRVNPEFAPSVTMDRVTQPTIPIEMSIKGPQNENYRPDSRYGVKLGGDTLSDGPGSGGGQGNGRNGGQGSGNGPGAGSGSGGGIGGGRGGGIGDGDGLGGFGVPPPRPVGITSGVKIISKPKPGYTDSARVANVQGTVTLRVVFLASGQIGSVSPVKGLPNGLTEQAIACAKRISFEPAKSNGIPQTVTKMVEYSFSIY